MPNGARSVRKSDGPGYQPLTGHPLNPVPCVIVGGGAGERFAWRDVPAPGSSNLAATCLNLLGFAAPDDHRPSVAAAG